MRYVGVQKTTGADVMIDTEVARLRRLRGTALRVRAVARSLGGAHGPGASAPLAALLDRGRYAAWRIARAVSGRLRAHPYQRFQKDAGVGVVLKNSLVAAAAGFGARSERPALLGFETHLRQLAKELDGARALTWASDLSDSFGRSQIEIRSLLAEVGAARECAALTPVPEGLASVTPAASRTEMSVNGPNYAANAETDWPYLAF
jgi:hypothetical protein